MTINRSGFSFLTSVVSRSLPVILCSLVAVNTFSAPPPLRIMPLGDSITYGASVAGGYRLPLYIALTNLGYNVDFVGSAYDNAAAGLGAEIHHEGHSGWRISNPGASNGIYEYIPGWLPTYADPDVILVHIGTNDTNDPNFQNAINELDALVTYLVSQRPFAHIIVTTLMKRGADETDSKDVLIDTYFNPYVESLVQTHQAAGHRVHFLNMHAYVDRYPGGGLSSDQLHPDAQGYAQMAAAWFPVVTNVVTPYGDLLLPAVASVRYASASTLSVTFSKPIDIAASTALTNAASWGVSPAGSVTAVSALSADLRSVTLTVSGLAPNAVSTISFNGSVTDLVPASSGGPLTATFSGTVGSIATPGRIWSGLGPDSLWGTVANWSDNRLPGTATAVFSGNGNGKTAVTLGSGASAVGVTFASDASAYTVGLSSETLTLSAGAAITLAAGSANSQSIPSALLASGDLYVYNNEPSKSLTLNYTNTANRIIYVYGTGPITFDTLRRPAGSELSNNNTIDLKIQTPGTVTCTGPITLGDLWKDSNFPPSEFILAPHTTNIFCRDSWDFALSGCTISGGEGTVLRLGRPTAGIPAAIAVQTAYSNLISCRLECPSGLATLNAGGNGWVNGTLVLTYPDNDIPGNITFNLGNCLQVPFVAPIGSPNPLGSSPTIIFTNPLNGSTPARLRVTSADPSSTDKAFTVDKDRAAIQNAGSGTLTLSGPISGNGAIVFEATAGNIVYSGIRSGPGGITKEEPFALTLSGANTSTGLLALAAGATTLSGSWTGPAALAANASLDVSGTLSGTLTLNSGATLSGTAAGAVTINAGGALAVLPGATLSGSSVLINGGALTLNPAAADSFTFTVPALAVTNANAFLSVPAAATASSVTISGLTLYGKTLCISAPAAGTAQNRIFITGLANGPASGILLNGLPAAYSDTDGIYTAATTLPPVTVTDDQIPNAPGSAATVSDAPAVALALAQPSVTLGQLDYAATSAGLLDLGGGVLGVSNLVVSGAALTVTNGTLTAAPAPSTNAFYSGINQPRLDLFTDDASTGISTSKTYTHLLDPGLSGDTVAVINGVTFTKITTNTAYTNPVTGFGWSGIPAGSHDLNYGSGWTNAIPRPAGDGLFNLVNGMGYLGNNMTITLSGLTPGAVYEFRAYGRQWDNIPSAIDRTHVWTFYTAPNAAPVAAFAFDQNHTPPHALTVRYVAASSNLVIKTWRVNVTTNPDPGIYGLTNEKLADAPADADVTPTTLTLSAPDAALTVAAAVGDTARPVSLVSSGNVTFEGPATILGTTVFASDLALAPSAGSTQYLGGAVSGSGALVKSGPGTAVLLAANAYPGGTAVSGGIINAGTSSSFGTGPVDVQPGAAVGLADVTLYSVSLSNVFTIAGSGPDGLGALRNDTTALQLNAFKSVTLSDNATVGGGTSYPPSIPLGSIGGQSVQQGRFDIRNGFLDFGGHSLTKAGNSAFILTSDRIFGVTNDTSVDVTGGTFGIESTTDLGGSSNNTLTVRSGAAFDFYNITAPILWSLVAENGAHLSARSGSSTQNNWAGPVTLQSGTVILDGPNTRTISGRISGNGGLLQAQGNTFLRNPANTFTGPTTITNGLLYSTYDGTIPNPAAFTLSGGGLYAYLGDGTDPAKGWTAAGINALVTQGAITPGDTPSLYLDATPYAATVNGALPSCRIRKYGTNTLTRSVNTPSPGILHVHSGIMALTSGLWDAAANNKALYVGAENNSNYLGVVRLSGNAAFRHRDTGYNSSGSYTIVGDGSNSRGILTIGDSASYTGRLYAGNSASAGGAVYQTGGTVLDLGGAASDSRFGYSGFGHLDISGGSFTTKGYTQFGHQSGSYGTLHMTGGSFTFNSGTVPANGVIGDYYGGTLSSRGGNGHLFLEGGSLTTGATYIQLPEDQTQNAPLSSILTVGGNANVSTTYLLTGNYQTNVPTSIVNLNGGRFSTGYIQKGNGTGASANNANAQTYINFNGGKLALTAEGAVVRKSGTAPDPRLTVYEGGAVIDANTHGLTLDYPLAAPTGAGVAAISVFNPGSGYIAPPFVLISGGGGTGAVAVAVLDAVPGKISGFRILCPGTGYTSAPTVTLGGGGFVVPASGATAVLGPVAATGGLSLTGPGSLTLTAANTYRGPTAVTNAYLALASSGSITTNSALILDNASFSAPGRDLTNALLRVSGDSTLIASSLTAAALDKTGPGTLNLYARLALTTNAPVAVATDFTPIPGLAEGFVVGTGTNWISANPCFETVPTWRALNGYVASGYFINNAQWPDNTTYIYSGYLWNRQSSSVTWTFACYMDDHIQLKIDDAVVVERGGFITTSDTPLRTVTLSPGPHKFELRAGQGAGSVGGYWTRSDGTRIAIGVDKLNRGLAWSASTDFADTLDTLVDPGDGSLFTVNSPYVDTLGLSPATGTGGVPSDILALVGDAADGYSVTYGTDAFPFNSSNIYNCADALLWQTNNFADAAPFDRVAYFVELEHPTYGHRWVWAAFDAHTVNRRALAFPGKLAGERFLHQCKVNNLTVRSNVSNITEVTDSSTGNIEVFPANYSNGTVPANGLAGRTDIYDFDDTPAVVSSSGSIAPNSTGYGCFQVHNWGTGETLFAVNNFGNANNTLCMGVGNRPGAVLLPNSAQLDYTFDQNANGYTLRRFYILTRNLVYQPPTLAPVATVTEGTLRVVDAAGTIPVPVDIRAKVGSIADGYDMVYYSPISTTAAAAYNGTAYATDNSAATAPFDRVAYFLEIKKPSETTSTWVWVSFNAHTQDRTKLGYPNRNGATFMWQQKVFGMDVRSNSTNVNEVTGADTGNLEIWPSNYGTGTIPALGLGGDGATFDFDDSGASASSIGHGSFQIHNWGAKQVLFSISHCGGSGNGIGLGIGNDPNPPATPPTAYDYTWTYNAGTFDIRNLYVFVRPTSAQGGAGHILADTDVTLAAGTTLDLNANTQTVRSVTGLGTVSNGTLAAGVVLSPAGDGVVGTLALSGIQLAGSVEYRADLGDLLDVTGSLNVTDMVLHIINPEALDRQQTYTLIQTTDGVTGVPTPDAPLPSGWKAVRRSQAILLLSEGGTLLFVK